jgi:multiple antibiotic resistance protein
MLELFVTVLAALFSVVDPPGAIPLFLAMTPDYTKKERNETARNTAFWFIALMLAFFLAGTYILSFFGITLNAVRIAGGLIILSSGYALLEGKFGESRAINDKVKDEAIEKEDISFAPLAMPMLSGPGSISLLIGMYAENPDWSARGVIIAAVLI